MGHFQGEVVHRQCFFDVLLALGRANRRLDHRHRVVRHARRTESKQRRLRITQRVDLAPQIVGEVLEAGFDRPPVGVEIGNPHRVGRLPRQVGEDVQLGLAVLVGLVQSKGNPPRREALSRLGVVQTNRVFVEVSPSAVLAGPSALPLQLPGKRRGVLPNHEASPAATNAEQKPGRAEVAVRQDAIAGRNAGERLVQQRPFLGISLFAGDHVGHQVEPRIVEHQRLSRQDGGAETTQLENAMFGARQMVPIQHPHAITRQQRRGLRSHRLDAGEQFLRRIMHQRRRDLRFQVLQLVVDGLPRDGNLVRVGLVVGSHRRRFLEHDAAHDLNALGESQLLRVAQHGVVLEHLIQHRRFKNAFDRRANHHTDRTPFHKHRQRFARQHPCRSCFPKLVAPSPPRCGPGRSRSDTINPEIRLGPLQG